MRPSPAGGQVEGPAERRVHTLLHMNHSSRVQANGDLKGFAALNVTALNAHPDSENYLAVGARAG